MKKKGIISATLIGGLVVAGTGAGGVDQAKAAPSGNAASLARQGIGQQYRWGANDCSGFTMKVFARLGVNLPHSSAGQAAYGAYVSRDNLQPGDLVFFNTNNKGISHVGIYVGNNQMISAENEETGVRQTQIFDGGASSYWEPKYVTARRISESTPPAQKAKKSVRPAVRQAAPASNTTQKATSNNQATPSGTYKIQDGDTLSGISQKTDVSVSQLKALNGLNSNQIRSGQVLRLKGNPISPSKAPSKVSAAKPAKASAAKPTTASAAEPAKVPAAKPKAQTVKSGVKEAAQPAQSAERPAAAQSDKVSGGTYFVRTGDSLWAISRHHGISVSEIKLNNHLKSDVIYPGQKLNFNVQNKGQTHNQANKTYAIKRGDTLWDIARAHGTTVSKLMKENHLHSSLIFAGDQLKLPKK